ncbi:hypothetical protein JCM16814_35140 [Desulfobaculum senezii]
MEMSFLGSRQMRKMGLMAVMDWYSRAVLSWRLSNTMDAEFYASALEEAMSRYACQKSLLFAGANIREGYTMISPGHSAMLVSIYIHGRGRWMDNVMIERLWRYLQA